MDEQKKSCSVLVKAVYPVYSEAKIEIPGIESFHEIAEWFIKWNVFNYRLSKSESFRTIDLGDICLDDIRQDTPEKVEILSPEDKTVLDEQEI